MKTMLFLAMALVSVSAKALVPPPYMAFNRLQAFLEKDSCFKIQGVQPPRDNAHNYSVRIDACSKQKASAWQLLKRDFSGESLSLQFTFAGAPAPKAEVKGATPAERALAVANLIQTALQGNKLFYRSESTICPNSGCFYPFAVTVEMEPAVVQTYMDDLSERYGNQNRTAAEHLSGLMADQIEATTIGYTTRNLHQLDGR